MAVLRGTATTLAAALVTGCGVDCRDYDACGDYTSGGRPSEGDGTSGVGVGGALADGGAGAPSGGVGSGGGSGTDGGGANGTSGTSGTSAADGGDGAGGTGEVCTDSTCAHDAIFVARHGDDANEGTPDAPVATLTEAIARASSAGKRVIACAETFTENVVLSRETNAKLEGGYECTEGWTLGDDRTIVQPQTGVPLTIRDVERLLEISNFEFDAPAGTTPGSSSIGAVITKSSNVVFQRVRIAARDGQPGADGVTEPYQMGTFATGGNAFVGENSGGAALVCTCDCVGCAESDIPRSIGGRGGDGGPGMEKQAGDSGLPSDGGGRGGDKEAACSEGGGGARGGDATAVEDGEGATRYGELTPTGEWRPASGTPGKEGKVGPGGGGGRSSDYGGGGGGACGGCGGRGGAPGAGGGSSIGIISVDANIAFIETTVETGAGGDGGKGAPGQLGQMGGSGGDAARFACKGGDGGNGSDGGSGGSGAGGLSVGILFQGRMPNGMEATSFRLGPSGRGGAGEGSAAGTNGDSSTYLDL